MRVRNIVLPSKSAPQVEHLSEAISVSYALWGRVGEEDIMENGVSGREEDGVDDWYAVIGSMAEFTIQVSVVISASDCGGLRKASFTNLLQDAW